MNLSLPIVVADHHNLMRPKSALRSTRRSTGRKSSWRSRNSSASASSTCECPPCAEARVYKLEQGGRDHFYTWLTPTMFDHLKSPAGEKELLAWLHDLEMSKTEQFTI